MRANFEEAHVVLEINFDNPGIQRVMIFFTTFVTLIRRQQGCAERRTSSPARVEGNILRLPLGTEVQLGDLVEHRPPNDELRMMTVIDVIHPYMLDANNIDDHIEVTCVDSARVVTPEVRAPALHPSMAAARALAEDGQMSEAVSEALRLVEERVRSLTASNDTGRMLMESVFSGKPPPLDITTTTGQAADDEREGFRLLFIGTMRALRSLRGASIAPLAETLEYLAVASMLMRRLDLAESRLGQA
jgi:uncharacterized protein (TIGR02391 family)